jgi:hypothetical protein
VRGATACLLVVIEPKKHPGAVKSKKSKKNEPGDVDTFEVGIKTYSLSNKSMVEMAVLGKSSYSLVTQVNILSEGERAATFRQDDAEKETPSALAPATMKAEQSWKLFGDIGKIIYCGSWRLCYSYAHLFTDSNDPSLSIP